MKKLLLHTCCGPCSIHPLDYLRAEGHEVYGYFYNPNIHPYTEFERRQETLAKYAKQMDWKVIFDEDYRLEEFLRAVVHREAQRCRYCYGMRLRQAALVARKGNFDSFSTTLLVSPFQKHELIREIGEAVGQEYGVPFYYADFRPGFKEATVRSKELEMYRQQYCGCIYSEKDRYYRSKKVKK
ncbi:epoxyqueuosine reductase QueH [Desulfolucanica intricata]|uniref:epoxyqueuosine reductase QueH n=1 Tax=Desulfolucanica intricata TaxID=1285191 RepID=UPI00082BC858|nr:epoxyqueuosine reductase QueH [Desulfolucanica intricata]